MNLCLSARVFLTVFFTDSKTLHLKINSFLQALNVVLKMKTGVKHDFLRLLKIPTIQNPGKNWVKRFEDLKFDYIPSYLSHRMTNLVNLQTKHVCCFRITLKYHVIHIFVRINFPMI